MYYCPIVHHNELWTRIEQIRIWEEMLGELRARHIRHFAARLTADLFTRVLDMGIRAGIVGEWMIVEIVR